jgi:mannose-6-phosphate isomerase
MTGMTMPPLRFRPIFHSMLWGGDRLRPFFGLPASPDPVGEAWLLSDVDGNESIVAGGPCDGRTLRDLLRSDGEAILGATPRIQGRFPLLLKLIDAKLPLSVQVHPNDDQAHARRPGQNGKTEAWVVLEANPATSRMYAGVGEGMTEAMFRDAMARKALAGALHSFIPKPHDCVFLNAGTIHAIGAETFLFEVQQTSDITYRLYDWDRVDARTGQPRELHLDDGLAVSNFAGPCRPVTPVPDGDAERLVDCPYFTLTRHRLTTPATWAPTGRLRVAVVIEGRGTIADEQVRPGDTVLLPAAGGAVAVDGAMTVLECTA